MRVAWGSGSSQAAWCFPSKLASNYSPGWALSTSRREEHHLPGAEMFLALLKCALPTRQLLK